MSGEAPAPGQAASPLLCHNQEVMDALMDAMGNPERFLPQAPLESYSSWQRRAIVEHIAPLIIAHAAVQERPAPGDAALRDLLERIVTTYSVKAIHVIAADALVALSDKPAGERPAPVLADAMAEARGYREALMRTREALVNATDDAQRRLRNAQAIVTAALPGGQPPAGAHREPGKEALPKLAPGKDPADNLTEAERADYLRWRARQGLP